MTNLLAYVQITLGQTTAGHSLSCAPQSSHQPHNGTRDTDNPYGPPFNLLHASLLRLHFNPPQGARKGRFGSSNGTYDSHVVVENPQRVESHRLVSARAEKGEKWKRLWLWLCSIQHTGTHNYRVKPQPTRFVYGNYHPSTPFKLQNFKASRLTRDLIAPVVHPVSDTRWITCSTLLGFAFNPLLRTLVDLDDLLGDVLHLRNTGRQ